MDRISGGGDLQSIVVLDQFFLYFFDWDQSLRVEGLVWKVVVRGLVCRLPILLLFLELKRNSFG